MGKSRGSSGNHLMADEPVAIATPAQIRALLPIVSRMSIQQVPVSVWEGLIDIYEDADGLMGWNRDNIHVAAQGNPVKYMEGARARAADLGARIVALIAFIDKALEPKGPFFPPPPPSPPNTGGMQS